VTLNTCFHIVPGLRIYGTVPPPHSLVFIALSLIKPRDTSVLYHYNKQCNFGKFFAAAQFKARMPTVDA
jgi:hypothetical protein